MCQRPTADAAAGIGAPGQGKFEPISQEQAFTEITAKIGPLREVNPEALGISPSTRTGMITIRGFIRMFGQMWGTPNVETTDPFCAASRNLLPVDPWRQRLRQQLYR